MRKKQAKFVLKLMLTTLVLFGCHWGILNHFFSSIYFFYPLWQLYLFNFVVVLIIVFVIHYKANQKKSKVLNSFLVLTILKMIVSILFLLPLLLSDSSDKKIDVLNFFIPYFALLFFEVYSLKKILS